MIIKASKKLSLKYPSDDPHLKQRAVLKMDCRINRVPIFFRNWFLFSAIDFTDITSAVARGIIRCESEISFKM